MEQLTLYLFVGYPGAGKTNIAQLIAERTRARHLWSDHVRHDMFTNPTHSETESATLYEYLNGLTGDLLASGVSVVFDTNFNRFADREKLRRIASEHSATAKLIWVTTPAGIAKERAVGEKAMVRNGYAEVMTEDQFDQIASKLEPPTDDENPIKLDCTNLDTEMILQQLSL